MSLPLNNAASLRKQLMQYWPMREHDPHTNAAKLLAYRLSDELAAGLPRIAATIASDVRSGTVPCLLPAGMSAEGEGAVLTLVNFDHEGLFIRSLSHVGDGLVLCRQEWCHVRSRLRDFKATSRRFRAW